MDWDLDEIFNVFLSIYNYDFLDDIFEMNFKNSLTYYVRKFIEEYMHEDDTYLSSNCWAGELFFSSKVEWLFSKFSIDVKDLNSCISISKNDKEFLENISRIFVYRLLNSLNTNVNDVNKINIESNFNIFLEFFTMQRVNESDINTKVEISKIYHKYFEYKKYIDWD